MRTDERRWDLVRTFFRSYRGFHEIFQQYESRVTAFTEMYGKDRRELKLAPEELRSLFDASALASLCDGDLQQLKDVAQRILGSLEAPDAFFSHVTNIYHEVSILKEEHWTVREDTMRQDRKAYDRYYREVNIYYPRRLRHVRNLYGKSRRRMEAVLLPTFARNKIIVRSMYLFGDRLVRGVYAHGVRDVYRYMYPSGGALTGYALAADSFLDGGFAAEAATAYDRALDVVRRRRNKAVRVGADERVIEELTAQGRNLARRKERALALD